MNATKEAIPAVFVNAELIGPSAVKDVNLLEIEVVDLSQPIGSENLFVRVAYSAGEWPNGFKDAEIVLNPASDGYDPNGKSNMPIYFCIRRDVIGCSNGASSVHTSAPIRPEARTFQPAPDKTGVTRN